MTKPFDFLVEQFNIKEIRYQAGNEFAWNSTVDTQACIIEAGYILSVTARQHGLTVPESFSQLFESMIAELEADDATIPRKDSYWDVLMRSGAAIHVLKTHKDIVRQVTEHIVPAITALYEALGSAGPGLEPERYFQEQVETRVLRRG